MGHIIFTLLHLVALLFFTVGLVVTIPLHIVYAAIKSNRKLPSSDDPKPDTHRRCPECREFVRADASRCKHCTTALIPAARPLTKEQRARGDVGGFISAVRASDDEHNKL